MLLVKIDQFKNLPGKSLETYHYE